MRNVNLAVVDQLGIYRTRHKRLQSPQRICLYLTFSYGVQAERNLAVELINQLAQTQSKGRGIDVSLLDGQWELVSPLRYLTMLAFYHSRIGGVV